MLIGDKEIFENTISVTDVALAWGVSYEICVDPGTCMNVEGIDDPVTPEIQDQENRLKAAQTIYGDFKE